jgi:hypothetical protein
MRPLTKKQRANEVYERAAMLIKRRVIYLQCEDETICAKRIWTYKVYLARETNGAWFGMTLNAHHDIEWPKFAWKEVAP